MFNEQASSLGYDNSISLRSRQFAGDVQIDPNQALYQEVREVVGLLFEVEQEIPITDEMEWIQRRDLFLLSMDSQLVLSFRGRLTTDAEYAYTYLDDALKPHDLFPLLRQKGGVQFIHIVRGRVKPIDGGRVLSLILFIMTVFSVLFVGMLMAISDIGFGNPARAQRLLETPLSSIWLGLPYGISIMTILGAHELGHYFAARFHKTAASLPYFLPFPFGLFGTFGAAIRLREPMRNRKVLFDIGASGPLAGLVFAIPILFIGLATSDVGLSLGGFVEGNSIFYALAKLAVFGEFLPSVDGRDVFVNQMAWAGWTGLLVTGLNLIPVGQLDGGHILYALVGRFAKLIYYPLIGGLLILTITLSPQLLFFVLLLVIFGNMQAIPLNDITPLGKWRKVLAVLCLIIFLLVFVPIPLQQARVPELPEQIPAQTHTLYLLPAFLIVLWQHVHKRG
jgi:Zn-dependent protease